MGTTKTTYVIFGYKLECDFGLHEKLEEFFQDGENALGVKSIADGMNGDYLYVGQVLAEADEIHGFEDHFTVPHFTPRDMMAFKKILSDVFEYDGIPEVHIFTHWQ